MQSGVDYNSENNKFMTSNILEAEGLFKIFHCGSEKVYAVNDVSLAVEKGSITSIIGPSGSGKSVLLNILGCLDSPTSGALKVEGREVFKNGISLSENELTKIRRRFFGYVFQRFFLIPTLTVYENITLPSAFYKIPDLEKRAEDLLKILDISNRKHHLPSELSTGQMQRVAIARALINNPSILLADEPTGNLDSKRSEEVKQLFLDLNKNHNVSIIFVTHNPDLVKIAHRVLEIQDGKIMRDSSQN